MKVQCKDVPTIPILEFLSRLPVWGNWCFGDQNDVHNAMPADVPDKVVLAKMNRLIRKGLVDGCPCGCRGNYELTEKGHAAIAAEKARRDNGGKAEGE